MSKKPQEEANPFLKKANGPKPPTRKDMKRGGLNKGLDALIRPAAQKDEVMRPSPIPAPAPQPPPPPPVPGVGSVLEVPPLDIERCPWQARVEFADDDLRELAESIKANGIIQPLICRRLENGRLQLIGGERRLRASVIAGLPKVKVVLVEADDRAAAAMNVVENIQRRDLNPIEEAFGYRVLQETFGLTQEEVSERVGKGRATIANSLRLLELPDEVKQLITSNLISTGHAKVLLSEDDEKQRIIDARAIVTEGLTVRALEARIAKRNMPVQVKRPGTPDLTDAYVRSLTDEIRRRVGCAVRLTSAMTHANGRRSKGVLEFDFVDNDDLDRLLNILGVKLD